MFHFNFSFSLSSSVTKFFAQQQQQQPRWKFSPKLEFLYVSNSINSYSLLKAGYPAVVAAFFLIFWPLLLFTSFVVRAKARKVVHVMCVRFCGIGSKHSCVVTADAAVSIMGRYRYYIKISSCTRFCSLSLSLHITLHYITMTKKNISLSSIRTHSQPEWQRWWWQLMMMLYFKTFLRECFGWNDRRKKFCSLFWSALAKKHNVL